MKILVIISNGFEEVEALASVGILRRAHLDVDIASISGNNVTGKYNVTIEVNKKISDLSLKDYDLLLIPGGPQFIEFLTTKAVTDTIRFFHDKNKYIAAICAGPTILGKMGLLRDKKYTCFTSMNEEFMGTYIDQPVVVDDKLITGRSAAATIDFAFCIVEILLGKDYADKVKESIYY